MAIDAKDVNGRNFGVGAGVAVRCIVTAITAANSTTKAGAGDSVTVTVQTPGNTGEKQNVSFTISPVQCQVAEPPSILNGN